ncbi:MAG: histone deacetylase [Bacteriovoracaceae bacterium]|nr:histone deacetylase [Bacteriovoracaceae bacterium]
MILYHSDLSPNWGEYGILIPLRDDRSKRVFEHLRSLGKANLLELNKSDLEIVTQEDLLRVHSKEFIDHLYGQKLESEILDCFELVDGKGNYNRYNPALAKRNWSEFFDSILHHVSASKYAMEKSLEKGFTFFLGGGMHHARTNKGSGFCLVNDIVVGIRALQDSNKIKRAWVIDTDAHKGDGTSEITHKDPSIKTLSIHMKKGWPLDHPDLQHPSKIPSDVDIEMDCEEESFYNERLRQGLNKLWDHNPDKPDFVVVNAGVDPYELDELPSTQFLRLSKEQMLERDLMVYNFFKERGIAQCWLMSGGYGKFSWEVYSQFLEQILE